MTTTPSARRAAGTGSIIVQDGCYFGKWRVQHRQVKRKLGPVRKPGTRDGLTKTQAEAVLRKLMTECTTTPITARLTVHEAGEQLLAHLATMNRKPSTLRAYRSKLNAHIAPALGSRPINHVTGGDVDRLVATGIASGLAPKTVRHVIALLGLIYTYAMRQGWANQNPVKYVELPKPRRDSDHLRYLDADEVETLLASLPDTDVGRTYRALYATAAMTGARLGELIALQWQDIDWAAQRIRITRNFVEGEYGTPKSGHGRSVPLADRLGGELDRLFQTSPFQADADTIFCHATGAHLHPRSTHRAFQRHLKNAGVRRITFHELRHTFGTRMAATGAPMRTLQEWMGHADIQTTSVYLHYAPSSGEVALVNAAFASGPVSEHAATADVSRPVPLPVPN